jgi:hypothetical protein
LEAGTVLVYAWPAYAWPADTGRDAEVVMPLMMRPPA